MRHTLFALQVFLPLDFAGSVHRNVLALLRRTDAAGMDHAHKRAFYRDLAACFRGFHDFFERGVWEYEADGAAADAEFAQWCKGTRDDALAAEEALAAGGAYRTSGGQSMFVTAVFLLRAGGTSDAFVKALCDVPEEENWKRATMGRFFDALPDLHFGSVRSDAVFLRPGAGEIGLTPAELAESYYGYVRALT